MQDRPTYQELLAAVERFLETDAVPNLKGAPGFHARVAANTLGIIRRELETEDEHLRAEWEALDRVLGAAEAMPEGRAAAREGLAARNEALCELIRSGAADEGEAARLVARHVRDSIWRKLSVSNPELLARDQGGT